MFEILSMLSPGAVGQLFAPFGVSMPKGERVQGFASASVSLPLCFRYVIPCVLLGTCVCLVLCSVRLQFASYGVRHMLPYHYYIFIFVSSHLISLELYASLCYISCYLVSRLGCWSLKYRGSVDPSMCVVQLKAPILMAHIQGEPVYILETWGLLMPFVFSQLCKSRIVINPPKRGRL